MGGSPSSEKNKVYKKEFSKYDKNRDGRMNTNELRALLRALNRNPTETSLKKMMADIDENKNGSIEYDEFVKLMNRLDGEISRELAPTFEKHDKDNSGFISADELDAVFQEMGIELTPEGLQAEIKSVDLDGDGNLSFQEFKKLIGRI
ncbi:neo-calmodulin-like [Patiria miniata]|uniref:EF-hand domain-containing protein n=1 Tax=Patiria miniata TaxID=46514 RepID=A0A914AQZ4_PATMI|nr:neo-calmodulin-like [Patiria miniata]